MGVGYILALMLSAFLAFLYLYLLFLIIKSIIGRDSVILEICKKSIEMLPAQYDEIYQCAYASYENVSAEVEKLEKQFKGLNRAANYRKRQTESQYAVLNILSTFADSPNRDRFEKVDELYREMVSTYKDIGRAYQSLSEYRMELRSIAIRDLDSIASLIEYFSDQLISANANLPSDQRMFIPSSRELISWSDAVRNYTPESTAYGSEMFSIGQERGGVAGVGMMAVGGLVAVGEALAQKAEKEENYANAVTEMCKNIQDLVNAGVDAKKNADHMFELSGSLLQFHQVYKAQLMMIYEYVKGADAGKKRRSSSPVMLNDKTLSTMMVLVDLYNNANQYVAGDGNG